MRNRFSMSLRMFSSFELLINYYSYTFHMDCGGECGFLAERRIASTPIIHGRSTLFTECFQKYFRIVNPVN